ncbi:MAG: hypothetical protein DRP96_04025 [Candidatus Neomarinimicrobiota bacterium]|nr:MAG: hypothetical protein DRP96_04025 [Candidatus Neomarinimicrobiota bacterium]
MKKVIPYSIIFLVLLPVMLSAGITGKITGRVTDARSGEPLIGVNIVIDGTILGAATDFDGFYTILNVNPGTYSLRATMIGYQTMIQQNVQVMVDLTTTINFELNVETIKGEEIIVIAKPPMVQKDVTSTSFRINSDQIEQLQVVDFDEIIELQAGVVDGHFRGGRSGEVMYIVDGIPMNDAYSGETFFDVENDIVQELEVISGTFNAEYGQAMSGIVNIVTKEGQDYYSGKVSFFMGDYLSNHNDIYLHINDINPVAINNMQFNLNGPIPGLGERLSFNLIGRRYYSDGWMYGRREFDLDNYVSFGDPDNPVYYVTGDSNYVSLNYEQKYSLQGKLTWKLSDKDKINFSSFYQSKEWEEFDRLFKYNPDGNYERYQESYQNSVQLTHLFNAGTFITANFSHATTNYEQYSTKDTADYVPIEYLIATGATGFSTGGMRMWRHFRDNTTNIGKVDLSSQMTRQQKIGLGISYKQCELHLHEYQIYFDENYTLKIPSLESWYHNEYTHKPVEFSAYVQDKIELGDMIINLGLRYDYFDPDGEIPIAFDTLRFDIYTSEADMRKTKASHQISPRFGIAYPISDRGVIHFSYGHFFQVPNYEYLYLNPDYEVSLVQLKGDQPPRGRWNAMGNPELEPEKTVSYEIGIKQALSDNFTIDVTAYNKDIRDLIGMGIYEDIRGQDYWRFINRDYANVKGITFAMEHFETPGGIGFSVDYTYQVATGNSSDPFAEWENSNSDVESEKKRRPLDWDQTHSLNLSGTTTQKGYRISLIGKIGSGTPYTRASARYSNRIYNGEHKPMTMTFDLNISRDFRIASMLLSPYLKIYNLFDRKNMKEVYRSSGSADYDYDMAFQTYIGIKDVEEWTIQPNYYDEPRKVIIGCSISFGKP